METCEICHLVIDIDCLNDTTIRLVGSNATSGTAEYNQVEGYIHRDCLEKAKV